MLQCKHFHLAPEGLLRSADELLHTPPLAVQFALARLSATSWLPAGYLLATLELPMAPLYKLGLFALPRVCMYIYIYMSRLFLMGKLAPSSCDSSLFAVRAVRAVRAKEHPLGTTAEVKP